ncbi:hypothetical protein CsSME_00034745 [Camellia sinensis var. sinensis]
MEISKNKLIIRYFSNPNYLSSLFSHCHPFTSPSLFTKTLNPSLPHTPTPPTTTLHFHQQPNSHPLYSSISSTGSSSFFSVKSPFRQSLISLASYRSIGHSFDHPSFSLHGQFRLLSVSSSDKTSESENIAIGKSGSNVSAKQISGIIELIRSGEDDLELKLNLMGLGLSVDSLIGIFRFLNCERISALRFFVWVRDRNPSLYKNSDVCSLIIDNCGWLDDYETMLCLLREFRSDCICLNEKAFGFLPVLSSSNDSIMKSIRRVVELLHEAGGSCRGSGICGLLTMLSKLDLFEMAKFVIEITDKKASYYSILILEKCRRCCFSEACDLLEEMRQFSCDPDAKTYNYLLSALCKHDRIAEACGVLEEMKKKGCPPDAITFEILIYFSCRLGQLDAAIQFFDQMVSMGLEPRLTTHAAFIKGFFHSRQYDKAYNYVVDSGVKYKDSGNMIYSLLARLHHRNGNLITAGNILIEMMDKGLIPFFPDYIKIMKQLYRSGRTQLAGDLKRKFSRLRSESGSLGGELIDCENP